MDYKEFNSNRSPKNNNKTNISFYLTSFLGLIPVVSSAVCAVYVILMYGNIQTLLNDFGTINTIINNINTTKVDVLVDGLLALENCVLTKLPICS
jgi:hypothetical protein